MFSTPGADVIVVTTERGARELRAQGSEEKGVRLLVAGEEGLGPAELVRAHRMLFTDYGVRYLDCEGGATILEALRSAGLLDEIFVTSTDTRIDTSRHEGVKRLPQLSGARLIAEGGVPGDAGYVFRRWRLNER
jgi:riboflavin biosynthesis pyrimidine reductase